MYVEVGNVAAIEGIEKVPLLGPRITTIVFPNNDSAGKLFTVDEAFRTVKHVLQSHTDATPASFKSDNEDLQRRLYDFYQPGPAQLEKTITALRYANGATWQANLMGNPSSNGTGIYAPGQYIGVSSDATAPTQTDTTLVGEITSGSLSRAQGTFGFTAGATTYTQSKVFTSDQNLTLYKSALFNQPTSGNPLFGSLFSSSRTLSSGDEIGITESISF